MKVYGLWDGGANYGRGDLVEDLEEFDSIEAAKIALSDRNRWGYGWRQAFAFANRDPEYVYTPCVETNSTIRLWLAADTVDGVVYVPEYPDRIVEFSPRGFVRVASA